MNDNDWRAAAQEFIGLAEVIRTLRRDCPWHRAQTPTTLAKYLIEESYETLAAMGPLCILCQTRKRGSLGSSELPETVWFPLGSLT